MFGLFKKQKPTPVIRSFVLQLIKDLQERPDDFQDTWGLSKITDIKTGIIYLNSYDHWRIDKPFYLPTERHESDEITIVYNKILEKRREELRRKSEEEEKQRTEEILEIMQGER